MKNTSLYRNIAARTGGDIYIGIVGPVRTGKSTFIKQFMESTVLPVIQDTAELNRARDELPQAASGKTIMTTEPKFIPDEAVHIILEDGTEMRVRMVDSVGYLIPGVLGSEENGAPRMVQTPWSEKPLPFEEAAELGTRRVITEHATIAMLVTTDGSFGDIPRESYVDAEERVCAELSASSVPFAIVLNSATPESEEAIALAYRLEEKYNAPVALVNCRMLDSEDVGEIFELLLAEFPITELTVRTPAWFGSLPEEHPMRAAVFNTVKHLADTSVKMGDLKKSAESFPPTEIIDSVSIESLHPENGKATLVLCESAGLSHRIMSELTGCDISSERDVFACMTRYASIAKEYENLRNALESVEKTGYGIVMPRMEEITLDEPRIVKQAGGYGVKLRASAKSIHMIRAEIETELCPTVGAEAETEELAKDLLTAFENDPSALWRSHLFGKPLYELIGEGVNAKLAHMPEESRAKLSETLERIINEGSSGLICILL